MYSVIILQDCMCLFVNITQNHAKLVTYQVDRYDTRIYFTFITRINSDFVLYFEFEYWYWSTANLYSMDTPLAEDKQLRLCGLPLHGRNFSFQAILHCIVTEAAERWRMSDISLTPLSPKSTFSQLHVFFLPLFTHGVCDIMIIRFVLIAKFARVMKDLHVLIDYAMHILYSPNISLKSDKHITLHLNLYRSS